MGCPVSVFLDRADFSALEHGTTFKTRFLRLKGELEDRFSGFKRSP